MQLQPIDRLDDINENIFVEKYLNVLRPVVVKNITKNWKATHNWSLDYFADNYGDVVVPLYNSNPAKGKEPSRKPVKHLPLKAYIDILRKGPTDLRIFFFNILKKAPNLQQDFKYPDLGVKFFKKLPVLFFGGENGKVLLHYDIDFANNFHFNFIGEKKIILFPHKQKKLLYHVPYAIVSIEEIEFDYPDYEKYPALKKAEGYEVTLKPGEMLYIPSGYWHYIRYQTPCVSLTLRSFPKSITKTLQFVKNLAFTMPFDNLMRKLRGQVWIDYKNKKAITNAQKAIEERK